MKVGVVYSKIPSSLKIHANEKQTFSFFFTARTNIPGDLTEPSQEPWKAALADFKQARDFHNDDNSETSLMQEHLRAWDSEIWSKGNIQINGNDELAQVVQSSLYWILLSARADWPWSLSPGSLASNAYNGYCYLLFPCNNSNVRAVTASGIAKRGCILLY